MVQITSSVDKQWRGQDFDNIALLLKTKVPGALALAQRAADLMAPLIEEQVVSGSVSVQDTPKGVGLFVEDYDDLDAFLAHFTGFLAQVGLDDATITVLPAVPFVPRGEAGNVTHFLRAWMAVLATRGERVSEWGAVMPTWTIQPADREAIVTWMVDYFYALPGVGRQVQVYAAGRMVYLPVDAAPRFLLLQAHREVRA